MIKTAIHLFFLRKSDFYTINSKSTISILSIVIIGILTGINPYNPIQKTSGNPLFIAHITNTLVHGVIPTLTAFITITTLLGYWLRRGNRWNGEGNLLGLIAASWLIPDSMIAILVALGISQLLIIPLYIYSIIVGVFSLSNAIPKASRAYCLAGIILTFFPGFLAAAAANSIGIFFLQTVG